MLTYAFLNSEAWSKAGIPDGTCNYVDLSIYESVGRIDVIKDESAAAGCHASRAATCLLIDETRIVGRATREGRYAFISEEGYASQHGFAVFGRYESCSHCEFLYLLTDALEEYRSGFQMADDGAYPAVRHEVVAATQIHQCRVVPCSTRFSM